MRRGNGVGLVGGLRGGSGGITFIYAGCRGLRGYGVQNGRGGREQKALGRV